MEFQKKKVADELAVKLQQINFNELNREKVDMVYLNLKLFQMLGREKEQKSGKYNCEGDTL